ncbi:MAG: hypothetical protein IPP31_13565 [Chitinophagaceae bacterium]|nr:hypothetical protein [Chitinophagaceae bacterium]
MQKQNTTSILIAVLLILAAAISRVLMYPDNFSPMIGMAIFGGAMLKDKRLAFALPLFSMFLSDLMFEVFHIAPGFWGWGQLVGYAIFAGITLMAFSLKKVTVLRVAGYSILSSVIFFLLSNLSFFFIDNNIYHLYPQTAQGLRDCYVSALPFFRTSLIADLVYSGVLFGAYYGIGQFAIRKAVA